MLASHSYIPDLLSERADNIQAPQMADYIDHGSRLSDSLFYALDPNLSALNTQKNVLLRVLRTVRDDLLLLWPGPDQPMTKCLQHPDDQEAGTTGQHFEIMRQPRSRTGNAPRV